MKSYLIYNSAGEILQSGSCPEDHLHLQAPNELNVIEGIGRGDVDYIHNNRIIKRPESPVELIGKKLTFLPTPCIISINDTPYKCDDEEADLIFTYPGTYYVSVASFPYLKAFFEIIEP